MKDLNQFMKPSQIRFTGLLYLLVIICAGLSQGYIRGSLIISGDAFATANNISENMALFRFGIILDLIAFVLDAIISVMFYQMFRPYGKTLAMMSAALRLLAHPAIASLNLLNHFMAYQVLEGAGYMSVFSPDQLHALSLLFTDAHKYGYLLAGAFFGVHCFLLGVLIYRTPVFPRFLGGFLLGSAAGYLLETFGDFSVPGFEAPLALIVGVTAAIGELGLTLYMLITGGSKKYKSQFKNVAI